MRLNLTSAWDDAERVCGAGFNTPPAPRVAITHERPKGRSRRRAPTADGGRGQPRYAPLARGAIFRIMESAESALPAPFGQTRGTHAVTLTRLFYG